MARVEDETCPTCGAVYEVRKQSVIMRDKETYSCHVCGEVLREVNGAVLFFYKLIKRPDAPQEEQSR
jgi:transposase-like protein